MVTVLFVCVASQEKEMEKQKILYQQARLHARGAAEMVLQMISATKGSNELIVSQFDTPQGVEWIWLCIVFCNLSASLAQRD